MDYLETPQVAEKEHIRQTAGIVAIKGESILLVCHDVGGNNKVGNYGLPSGGVYQGESDQVAALREFGEETGFKVLPEDLLEFDNNHIEDNVPRKNGEIVRMSWKVFKVLNPSGELRSTKETIPMWLSFKQIEQLESQKRLSPNVFNMISSAMADSSKKS